MPRPPLNAPDGALRVLRGRGSAPAGDSAPRQRLPASADELAGRLQSMSLAETSRPRALDDIDIVLANPVQLGREERLQAAADRIAAAASPEDVRAMQDAARAQHSFAQSKEQALPVAPFSEMFVPGPANQKSAFRPLRFGTADFVDAAHAWQDAADHHAAVAGAAGKFGLEDVRASAAQAAQDCAATATRAEILGEMLKAMSSIKLGRANAQGGNYRALEQTAEALRAVLDLGREPGLQWLHGAGFDHELLHLARDTRALLGRASGTDGPYVNFVPKMFATTHQVPEWQPRFAAAGLALMDVAQSVRNALLGDAAALAAPAPPLPVMLIGAEDAGRRAARMGTARGDVESLGAWLGTLEAFGDLSHVLASVSARIGGDAPQAQAVQILGQHVEQGLGHAVTQVRGALERAAFDMQASLLAADASADAAGLPALQATAEGLAHRAGQFQAVVAGSATLQKLGLPQAAASDLAQPFVALQAASQAVAQAAAGFGIQEAAALKQAAAMAHAAAAQPGGLATGPMAELASFCTQSGQDVLTAAAETEHVATKAFLWQSRQESRPAGARLEDQMAGLRGLLAGDPLSAAGAQTTPSSSQPAQDADSGLIERMLKVAHDAEARVATATLPGDAPPSALATQRATRLMLQATSVAARMVAESLSVCNEALRALPQAAPRQRPKVAQALAERVRVAGTAVAEVLAEQIALGDGPLPEYLARVAKEQGGKLRHTERLAERIRVPLQALGLMFEAQLDAQAFRGTTRALEPAQVIAQISQVGKQCAQAETLLKAGAHRLVSQILAEKVAGGAADSTLLDFESRTVMQSFKDLTFRASIERELVHGRLLVDLVQRNLAHREHTRNVGQFGLTLLVDQVQQHVQGSNTEIDKFLTEPRRRDLAGPLQDAASALLQELQACREQVSALAQPAKAGPSGARASRRR